MNAGKSDLALSCCFALCYYVCDTVVTKNITLFLCGRKIWIILRRIGDRIIGENNVAG